MYKSSQIVGGTAWFGPYVTLIPGEYTAYFKIKVDSFQGEKIAKIDVWSNSLGSVLASKDINIHDLTKPLEWNTISLTFNITKRTPEVEFRGIDAHEDLTIWLDYVEVVLR
jgi:hypothetical protein